MKSAREIWSWRLLPMGILLLAVLFLPSLGTERLAPPPLPDPPPEFDTPLPNPLPDPVPEPEPIPEPTAAERALSEMDLRQKVYQLFVVFPQSLGLPRREAGEQAGDLLERYPVGGLIYDRTHLENRDQVRTMLNRTQSASRIPLILTCDEEGGRVNRLMGTVGTPYVGPMLNYRSQGAEKAAENAETIAGGLISCGFNFDLAPVADVWSNQSNTVIGNRAYSTDFGEAAELVTAAVEGFHVGGVGCTLKHFPGHGDTAEDSHEGSAYLRKSEAQLRREELVPFEAGIRAGADAVMVGHLMVPALDSVPAPFSEKIVTELLREELGFDGVVMTDSLEMKALSDRYDSGEIAVRAVRAGVDVLLCPVDLEAAAEALIKEAEASEEMAGRIDESALRVLSMKEAMGLFSTETAEKGA